MTEPPLSRTCCVGPVLHPAGPSLTSPGYSLPPIATVPVKRRINIERPSRLEPRTSLISNGTRAPTTRSPTLYRLSYRTGCNVIDHYSKSPEVFAQTILLHFALCSGASPCAHLAATSNHRVVFRESSFRLARLLP